MAQLDSNLKSLLDSAHSVALLLPQNPSFDVVAASLGLKLSLEQAGKVVTLASVEPLTVEFNRLVGVNTVTQTFGKRDLVISFPGQTDLVDKVSYNVDHGELQLVVTPKAGTPGLDPSKLRFIAGGPQVDSVIFVNSSINDWSEARDLLQNAKQYTLSSNNVSQSVTMAITLMQLPLGQDAASNLLAGLDQASNMYQIADADTFESAAILMRHGGHRQDVYVPTEEVPGTIPTAPVAPVAPAPQEDWYEPKVYRGTSTS